MPGDLVELRVRVLASPDGWHCSVAVLEQTFEEARWIKLLDAPTNTVIHRGDSRSKQARDLLRDVIQAGYVARRMAGQR
jgi:hypothetical protein